MTHLAHGALPASHLCQVVNVWVQSRVSVRGRNGKADAPEERKIGNVVAHMGDGIG